MKKIIIILTLLLVSSIFLIAQQCTIEIPEKVGITLETGQITEQKTASQTTEQQSLPRSRNKITYKGETLFLIMTTSSLVISLISAFFGFRKDKENTGGKILFAIFMVLFLLFLSLFILSAINII